LSTRKSVKIPDSNKTGWITNPTDKDWLNWGNTCLSGTVDVTGLTFDLAQTVNYPPSENQQIIQLLTDIWHNQATMIKWLSKIAEKPSKVPKRKKAS